MSVRKRVRTSRQLSGIRVSWYGHHRCGWSGGLAPVTIVYPIPTLAFSLIADVGGGYDPTHERAGRRCAEQRPHLQHPRIRAPARVVDDPVFAIIVLVNVEPL